MIAQAHQPHILVVDDDERLRSLLRRYLTEHEFIVTTASSAPDAREKLKSLSYDLMVLDVMMPGESGFELTKALRDDNTQIPILLLTARSEASDRIEGFESGADDYLLKPFEPRELLLRIQSILRRAVKAAPPVMEMKCGAWSYYPHRDELRQGEEVLRLTGVEANLMRIFAAHPGTVFSRETLAERSKTADRTIDVQVTRLRRKIEPDARNPRYIVTVRGEGYMLMPDL